MKDLVSRVKGGIVISLAVVSLAGCSSQPRHVVYAAPPRTVSYSRPTIPTSEAYERAYHGPVSTPTSSDLGYKRPPGIPSNIPSSEVFGPKEPILPNQVPFDPMEHDRIVREMQAPDGFW